MIVDGCNSCILAYIGACKTRFHQDELRRKQRSLAVTPRMKAMTQRTNMQLMQQSLCIFQNQILSRGSTTKEIFQNIC